MTTGDDGGDAKERAAYHMILSEMHRLRAVMLNMQTIAADETEVALREHFTHQQTLALGKLQEWKRHRPTTYKRAQDDFARQTSSE